MSSRRDLFTGAWYVQYVDDKGREQLVTYAHCAEALKAYYALERPVRFGMVFTNGRLQAYAVKEEVRQHGED